MFCDVTQAYDKSDATLEIAFMLAVALLLGYLLWWILSSKANKKQDTYHTQWWVPVSTSADEVDNLKVIEGIGPKIESLLNEQWVTSYADIVQVGNKWLVAILEQAGPKYQMHNPKTWPDQAALAMKGKWWELKEYQDLLSGGKEI